MKKAILNGAGFILSCLFASMAVGASAVPSQTVNFHVVGADGKPVPAKELAKAQAWAWVETDTDATTLIGATTAAATAGSFSLELPDSMAASSITKALIEVRVPGSGIGSARLDGWVSLGQVIKLAPGMQIDGRVVDEKGKPGPGANLDVERLIGDAVPVQLSLGQEFKTGQDGRFRISNLFPEHYAVGAGGTRSGPGWADVDLTGGNASITLCASDPSPVWMGLAVVETETAVDHPDTTPGELQVAARMKVDPDSLVQLPLLKGTVTHPDGTPAPGVIVLLAGSTSYGSAPLIMGSARSGLDGGYAIRTPAADLDNLAVADNRFAVPPTPVHPADPGGVSVDLKLLSIPAASFHLLSPDGKPIAPGTRVFLSGPLGVPDGWEKRVETTGPGGRLEIRPAFSAAMAKESQPDNEEEDTAPIKWAHQIPVLVEAPGVGSVWVQITDWPDTAAPLRLQPLHEVNGLVVNANGRGLAGVLVSLFTPPGRTAPMSAGCQCQKKLNTGSNGPAVARTRTDSKGHFEFTSLPDDLYSLKDEANPAPDQILRLTGTKTQVVLTPFDRAPAGWQDAAAPGPDFTSGQSYIRQPEMLQPVIVRGRVGSGSTPGGRAMILLYAAESSPALAMTFAAPDGSFRLLAPSPGRYQLSVAGRGVLAANVPFTAKPDKSPAAKPDKSAGLFIALPVLSGLKIRLVSPSGLSVPDRPVVLDVTLTSAITASSSRAAVRSNGQSELEFTPDSKIPRADIDRVELQIRVAGMGCAAIAMDTWPSGRVTVRLQPGITLRGTVRDSKQVPVGGAQIFAALWTGSAAGAAPDQDVQKAAPPIVSLIPDAITGPDGRFSLTNMLPGNYMIQADAGSAKTELVGLVPTSGPVRLTFASPLSRSASTQHGPAVYRKRQANIGRLPETGH